MHIDYAKCSRDGMIGGVGAIPGTLFAHFCDVIKMRQQLTGEKLSSAIRGVYRGDCRAKSSISAGTTATFASLKNFFAGAVPAVQQKVATRSTMFLASSASVQLFENKLGFNPTSAAFVGSASSGYITGSIASPWEWQKVLVSQRIKSPAAGNGVVGLFVEAKRHHGSVGAFECVGKRMHAAGVRNAIFDSTFFGVKRILENWNNVSKSSTCSEGGGKTKSTLVSSGFAYGVAAVTAVTVDYAVDVSVKRTYATGPESAIPSVGVLHHTLHMASREGLKIFRGLGAKSVEFGISYTITGLMAPYISSFINLYIPTE
eukprot:CAMPEP_0183735612 /NCGR_PEP_ID=MMETSP0737-20130205/47191_1 /TAXON_ID=385413 /ORGANISM="Thalassiosira miniscula, Strain CCMP1093" /LENGTH=315 /DNA_ID=CAMNT_0025969417 /DNA_START=66 /DNA_END=1010 /DNA_ORIENTATION=-